MNRIRVARGVSKRNPDGSITLPTKFLSDKSPRWGPWQEIRPAKPRVKRAA